MSLSQVAVPDDPFSIDGAMMLLPCFMLGVVFWRHRAWTLEHRRILLVGALVLLVIGSAWNIQILRETGSFSDNRRDLQSLFSAFGGCMVAMLALPRINLLDRIGPLSFTIYLYHVFGTSLMRRFLDSAGYDDLPLQVIAGIVAGVALPVLLHRLAERSNLLRALVLGLKPLQPQQDRPEATRSRAT